MRGKQASKRKIKPDSKFNLSEIGKFINYVMERGKKTTAQKIVYRALEIVSDRTKQDALEVFHQAMENAGPKVELRSRRVGGANYQVPVPTDEHRRFILASRWILAASRSQKGKPMAEKLADQLMEAYNNQGNVIKKKEDTYRMAEANRAFAHFARF